MGGTQRRILSHPTEIYSIAVVLLELALMLVPFAVSLPWPSAIAWILASCFVDIGVNLVNHNHIHCKTFRVAWLNRVMEILLTITRGSSASYTTIIHNHNHHVHENSPEDWFEPANQGNGPRPLRPLVYVWRTVRRFRKGTKAWGIPRRFRRAIVIEHLVMGAVLATLLLVDWRKVIAFVAIPLIVGNGFIVLTNLLHHDGAAIQSTYDNSYTYTNWLENLVYFNGGYHAVHHLRPSLHWSQLAAAHRTLVAPFARPEMTRGSMFGRLFRAYLLARTSPADRVDASARST